VIKTRLPVKVVPSSSRDCVAGWQGDTVRIKVQAPPEKGRANESVARKLAAWLGLPRSAVTLASGEKSADKVFVIQGMGKGAVRDKLA